MVVAKSTATNAHPEPERPFIRAGGLSLPSVIRKFSLSLSPNPHASLFLAKFSIYTVAVSVNGSVT